MNDLAMEVRAASRRLVRELGMLGRCCGSIDLTPAQAHALIELEAGPLSVVELAARLNVDKSNACRATAVLVERGYAEQHPNPDDGRSQLGHITTAGREVLSRLHAERNAEVGQALALLTADERAGLLQSLDGFRRALSGARAQQAYTLRPIGPGDDAAVAAIIRQVSAEYGLNAASGFGVADACLDALSAYYRDTGGEYWVIVAADGRVQGGGGVTPLAGGPADVCELQKMYFLPALRGKGFARRLVVMALDWAREHGYGRLYLETTTPLKEAVELYGRMGFTRVAAPLGATGHAACEICMVRRVD